jgi:hypothetical protein
LTLRKHTSDGIETFDSVLDKCPKLKRVTVRLYYPANTILPAAAAKMDFSKIATMLSVKKLKLDMVINNSDSLSYICKNSLCNKIFINRGYGYFDVYYDENHLMPNTLPSSHSNVDSSTLSEFLHY